MMKKIILIIICFAIFGKYINAQGNIQRADNLYLLMSYYSAASEYERLIDTDQDTPALRIRLANSYYRMGEFQKALKYYNYVDLANYDKEDLYNYIQTAKMNEDYSKADVLMHFFCQEFKDNRCTEESFLQQIESLKETVYFNVKPSNLSTEYNDIGVYSSADDEIFIVSDRDAAEFSQYNGKGYFDIFYARKLGKDAYSEPQKLKGEINSKLNEGALCIANGGKRIYFTRNNKNTVNDIHHLAIYIAEINAKGEWGNIRGLSINSDSYSTGHPVLTHDGKKMIFSSTMKGGYGGADLYIADVLDNGDLENVKNLGPKINTPRNELFPWIDNNGHIYFSSDGHVGFGGLDIFIAKMNGEKPTQVINCGININSPQDDFAIMLLEDGKNGYVASNRKTEGSEQYTDNIYKIRLIKEFSEKMVLLEDKIIGQSKDDNLQGIKVEIEDVEENQVYATTTDQDGKYSLFIPERLAKNAQQELQNIQAQKENTTKKKKEVYNINEFGNEQHGNETSTQNAPTTMRITHTGENEDNGSEYKIEDTKNYTVRLQKPGYETKEIPLAQRTVKKSERLPVSIDKLEVGNVLKTTVVYFDLDKYTITNQAKRELDIIVQMMNDNPNMVLETFSYTDCRASEAYNIVLSNNRAKSIISYIQNRIANPNRIFGKGYGPANPIVDCQCHSEQPINCAEEEHRLNRRTEFQIVKI